MRYQNPFNLLLALIVAFWMPMWCRCASHGAQFSSPVSSHESPACPNCLEHESSSGDSHHLPESSSDSDCPTCPHKLLRSWNQVEKSPQLRVEAEAPCFIHLPRLIEKILADTRPVAGAPVWLDVPPDIARVSLISLHCMLTI